MKRANKKKPVDDKPSEDVCDAAADEPAPASPIRSPALCPNLPPPLVGWKAAHESAHGDGSWAVRAPLVML